VLQPFDLEQAEAGMTLNSLKEKFKAGILLRELLVMTDDPGHPARQPGPCRIR